MKKLALYLYDRLAGATNVVFPPSVELTNDLQVSLDRILDSTDFGRRRITLHALTLHICDYMKILYRILQQYEAANKTTLAK
jgi:hypothetical protein